MTGFPALDGRRLLKCLAALALSCLSAGAAAEGSAPVRTGSGQLVVVEGDDIAFGHVENTQEFLPSRVGQVAQDDTGFMWFGTQYGLYRFDGYSHVAFAADSRPGNRIAGVFVHAVHNDASGRLWIPTDQGLDVFDPRTGKSTRVAYEAPDATVVQSIYQDRSGLVWLCTTAGLYGLDAAGRTRVHLQADPGDPASLSSNDVKFASEDRSGTLWVASTAGLDAIDPARARVTLRVPLQEPREIGFVEDQRGVLWIYHAGGAGLSSFDRSTHTLTHYRFVDASGAPMPRFGIYAALRDRDGGLWFGTGGEGILRLDAQRQRFIRYRSNSGDPQSLSGDDVSALFQDREGDIWVALHGGQLNLFPARGGSFRKLPPRPASLPSRSERMVNALLEVDANSLWISFMGMLLGVDQASGKREDLRPRLGLQADVISMARDPKGRIWLGTVGTGIVMREPSGRVTRFSHDPDDPGSLANDVVNDILVDRAGNVWFATWGGLSRFDERTGRFESHTPADIEPKYLSLAEDADRHIWLGSHRYGLHRFDPATDTFATYPATGAPGGMSNGRVNAVYVDRRGTVWAGTQNGLDALDPSTGRIRSYRTGDGLPGNAVSCILEDDRRGIWLGTNHGIARLDAASGHVRSYSRIDGLPGMDFTGWGTCHRGHDNTMYFAGFSGATAFQPDPALVHRRVGPVVFTDLAIAGRSYPDGAATSQPRVLPVLGKLRLPYARNSFTAGFASLSYTNPAAIDYRFRLAGLEDAWHVVDSDRRVAAYNSLPPGDYRLEVQAAMGGGDWSEAQALDLTILAPWWRTTWFHVLAGLSILGAALLAYRLRMRQLMQRFEIRLDERVSERTRIARELHDSLLQGFHGLMFRLQAVRNLLPARAEEAAAALDDALRRGDETVEMAREAVTGLRSSAAGGTDLGAALQSMVQDTPTLSHAPPPECQVVATGEPRPLIPLVRDDVLQVAREAFRNAVQHAQATQVRAEVEWGADRFVIRVRDDGVGLDSALIAHGRDRHWGMHGMRERTRAMGGSLEIRSEGAGTLVELRIPAGRAYARAG
jgi:ligand-binding sensor domain-containing protein/signal transduction histidine kinase